MGGLVADTLLHLANNEIDSDYFAIMSTSENGTEIEHELAITDYAPQAAGTVDELVKALEAAEKSIAELEAKLANPVLLPKTNGYWTEQEKAYEEAITLAKRQVRLAGFRCGGDE